MAFVLAVTWTAKPGNEAKIRELLQALGEASRQEPGVITYTTHEDPENPREFFIYEKYHDAAGLEAHQQTDHFQQMVLQQAIPLLESRVRRQYSDFE
jgi:quinol monooxygenase YgiN